MLQRSDFSSWAWKWRGKELFAASRNSWSVAPGKTLQTDLFIFGRWFSFDIHVSVRGVKHGRYVQKPNGDIELVP